MVAGRHAEPRAITVTTALTSTAITAPAGTFTEEDNGRPIAGAGIPAGATVTTTSSDTAATLSAAATAAGTVTATLGAVMTNAAQNYGFFGWSPETDAESESYSVTATNANTVTPDRITSPATATTQRTRG